MHTQQHKPDPILRPKIDIQNLRFQNEHATQNNIQEKQDKDIYKDRNPKLKIQRDMKTKDL